MRRTLKSLRWYSGDLFLSTPVRSLEQILHPDRAFLQASAKVDISSVMAALQRRSMMLHNSSSKLELGKMQLSWWHGIIWSPFRIEITLPIRILVNQVWVHTYFPLWKHDEIFSNLMRGAAFWQPWGDPAAACCNTLSSRSRKVRRRLSHQDWWAILAFHTPTSNAHGRSWQCLGSSSSPEVCENCIRHASTMAMAMNF